MTFTLVLLFLVQVLRISVPYILASLGGTLSERGGVVNLALEGIMLWAALACVLGSHLTGSGAVGVLAGLAGGFLVAAVLAWVTLRFQADAVVTGVALNLLAMGGTRFLLKRVWDSSSNSARVSMPSSFLEGEGATGALLSLLSHPLFLLAVGAVAATHLFLFHTPTGLRLRACGHHPAAAASVGIRVQRVQAVGVLASGLLAGLAGVWLAAQQHQFTDNMTGGRGYIALAAMIVGRWHPLWATAACLLFGAAEAAQILLQGAGSAIPPQILQMMPYLLTILAVVVFRGRR